MASNASVKKFQRVLAALPPHIRGPIRAEIFHQAELLKNQMRAAAPRGKTGALAASVRVTPGTRSRMAAMVRAGGQGTMQQVGSGFFGAFNAAVRGRGEYDYAIAQEFGTSQTPAQPFFWPTYRANKRRIRRAIKDYAVDAISEIVPLK